MPDSVFENFQTVIADNHPRELKRLLDAGYDLNKKFEKNGLTPLHLAAWYNHPHLIELLIDHGAKVNQAEEQTQKTPLHIAAYFGHLECCKVLVDKKASIYQQDIALFIPLHYAALRGHLKVAQLLSDNIKDLWEDSLCGAPIDVAIRHRNIDFVAYFLTKLEKHFSPLFNSSEVFSLSTFWKKTFFSVMSENPLYFATLIGEKDIVRLLLTKKHFQYTAEIREHTSLHLAAEKGYTEIVKLLLSDPEYPIREDMYLSSPLELAIKNGHRSTIEVFIERGAKPWLIDKVQLIGERPTSTISAAVWDGNYRKLEEILQHEGKEVLFEEDKEYEDPPLQLAILFRKIEIAKLFIEYGGKELILQKNSSQMTALHRAAFHGILDLYQLILHVVGTEFLKQPCEPFGTPLDCALQANHKEIVEWTLNQPKLDLSFEELFLKERDNWVLMDLNPKIGGYFAKMEKELNSAKIF